jgi:hypothetical protein
MISRLARSHHLRAALFILVALLVLRAPALLISVADFNESLYLLVARELVSGHLPYLTLWECKPPLLFFMIAGWSKLFGLSMLSYRFLADAAVFVTACAIYRIGQVFRTHGELIGLTAALTYVGFSVSDSGTASEAEIFIAPFISVAAALLLPPYIAGRRLRLGPTFVVGVMLGCATQMKATAALEALVFAVLAILAMQRNARAWFVFIAGAALPIVAGAAPYALTGTVPDYLDANIGSIVRRRLVPSHLSVLELLRQQAEAFFPGIVLALALPRALREAAPDDRRIVAVLIAWCVVDIATVVAVREYLAYQFLPAMVPVSLLSAWIVIRLLGSRPATARIALAVAVGTMLVHGAGQLTTAAQTLAQRAGGDAYAGDDTARIGAYLRAHRGRGNWLYVALDQPVLYLLTQAPVPTRFPYPPYLTQPEHEHVAGIDGTAEIERIFANHPRYVVFDGPLTGEQGCELITIAQDLRQEYTPVYAIGDRRVYRRRS